MSVMLAGLGQVVGARTSNLQLWLNHSERRSHKAIQGACIQNAYRIFTSMPAVQSTTLLDN